MKPSARSEAWAGAILLLVSLIFLADVGNIYIIPSDLGISARAFPAFVLGFIAALSLWMILRGLPELRGQGWRLVSVEEMRPVLRYALPTVALSLLFIQLIEWFQYLVPTAVVTAAVLALFGNRSRLVLVGLPLAVALLYYVLFYGLLGLFEEPGTLISYDSTRLFLALRHQLGF